MAFEIDGQSLITGNLVRSSRSDAPPIEKTSGRESAASEVLPILTIAEGAFVSGADPSGIVERLAGRLHELRRASSQDVWDEVVELAQQHSVRRFLMQDPLTNWSATKPRGYSGDAGLLDIYYKHPSMEALVAESSPLGRAIYDYTSEVPACEAGRERCRILARTVDETAQRVGTGAEIFAVAAGHLREAAICESLAAQRIDRWVALDQDPISVGIMTTEYPGGVVQPMNGSVLGLLRRSYQLGSFDLVYASGLYDYLQDKTAIKLLQRLVEFVRPGGTLLFANFSDEIVSDGYMETFMDWPLILRSDADMWRVINASIDRNMFDASVWYGANRNIVYGTLRRR
ncbi:class I SAM-dependent methyltransferase [Aureimonas flava]|uniref:Class I SAM-dependent methyltransferase n=1 Tax=Aureimonas flava TaxID=2320271 RepID=A0A3A1WG02_9HYPH|nr:class I SAM-dependent methyltransferase [Aureimonas flava]RIX97429.1 class I SAM-dependent methyltransferase [Aureimonas flava]